MDRKTGVRPVSPDLGATGMHTRASHTHKVALLARELAEDICRRVDDERGTGPWTELVSKCGGLDIAAAEAAGLAHDLGHPPFGHEGERVLDRELRKNGVAEGFEGNAQSFRIVTVLASHKHDIQGLNLTNVVLASILKYPVLRDLTIDDRLPKFGAYRSEVDELERARLGVSTSQLDFAAGLLAGTQSLEASIMDLADDIAYSLHDLEDFIPHGVFDMDLVRANLASSLRALDEGQAGATTPFTALSAQLERFNPSQFDKSEFIGALRWTKSLLSRTPDLLGAIGERALVDKLNQEVGGFFENLKIGDLAKGEPLVSLEAPQWHKMQVLKCITREYFVRRSRLGYIQRSQSRVLSELFDGLCDWLSEKPSPNTLPRLLRLYIERADGADVAKAKGDKLPEAVLRGVSDYICSMSDAEAFSKSNWLRGIELPGMKDVTFRS
jgi:dGTPase